jgi:hypothetical protein
MPRRLLALLALISVFAVMACQGAGPAAPQLSDPKEILTQSLLSLKNVKTVEITGSFTGAVKAAELGGNLDLSTIKVSAAMDIAAKKAKLLLDAPTILGTKIDAIVVDKAAYLKIAGPLAAMAGASADKYTKSDLPESSADPLSNATDVAAAVDELKKGLDALPTPPTKGADEKCGDQDCYHVTLKVTSADLAKIDPSTAAMAGDVTLDMWSRKSDVRPAKIAVTIASPEQGTFGATFEFKYDTSVTIDAPPADQVAP